MTTTYIETNTALGGEQFKLYSDGQLEFDGETRQLDAEQAEEARALVEADAVFNLYELFKEAEAVEA